MLNTTETAPLTLQHGSSGMINSTLLKQYTESAAQHGGYASMLSRKAVDEMDLTEQAVENAQRGFMPRLWRNTVGALGF